MSEMKLGVVEDTLYVPMLGRIYATKNCPSILHDTKALELKGSLPQRVIENDHQTQYTYVASASRSANMDRYIRNFLERKPNGVIVQLGCGLETTYNRNDNGHTQWYGVDLPNVITYRRTLLPESEREEYISGDAFKKGWIEQIRTAHPTEPILITASGLFYYFEEGQVLALIRMLKDHGEIELLFDTVNKSGMTLMQKKHMKTVGHEEAKMFFYVDSAKKLSGKIGGIKVLSEEPFYRHIPRKGLRLSTKLSMMISDRLSMVKMIHLGL